MARGARVACAVRCQGMAAARQAAKRARLPEVLEGSGWGGGTHKGYYMHRFRGGRALLRRGCGGGIGAAGSGAGRGEGGEKKPPGPRAGGCFTIIPLRGGVSNIFLQIFRAGACLPLGRQA